MQNFSYCPSCGWCVLTAGASAAVPIAAEPPVVAYRPKNQTWQHKFSIHYLGQYPIAELQCWGNSYHGSGHCEDMPLEMTADNLQMTAAAAFATGDFAIVNDLFPLFTQYADYLVAHGLDPVVQLCSDDFEGPSPHNANLAAKSIIGIATYAALCNATNRTAAAAKYMKTARSYAAQVDTRTLL